MCMNDNDKTPPVEPPDRPEQVDHSEESLRASIRQMLYASPSPGGRKMFTELLECLNNSICVLPKIRDNHRADMASKDSILQALIVSAIGIHRNGIVPDSLLDFIERVVATPPDQYTIQGDRDEGYRLIFNKNGDN